jgi:hypothetical protein
MNKTALLDFNIVGWECRSQRQHLMPPQKSVQPKNKVACTVAPLQNPEREADVSNLGDGKDDSVAVPSSIVVTADHGPGRDDGGPSGRRKCRSGLAMVDERPEPTWRTPMLHGRMLGDSSVAVG